MPRPRKHAQAYYTAYQLSADDINDAIAIERWPTDYGNGPIGDC